MRVPSTPGREARTSRAWPGERHLLFRTGNVDDACDRAQELLVRHRLDVDRSAGVFEATVHRARVCGLELMSFAYGAPTRIHSAPLERFVVIHVPRRGHVRFEYRGRRAVATPRRAAVFSAEGDIRMEWSRDLELLAVKVPQELLEQRVAELVGHPLSGPLRFGIGLGLAQGAVAGALGMAVRAAGAAGEGDVGGPLGAAVADTLVSALLLEHEHSYLEDTYVSGALPPSRVVCMVVDAVRADPGGAHTARGLAALAGISERALQLAFQRDTGMSPMACLRRVRLEAAREALAAARPEDGVTVLDIAVRCGFGHPGRFAAAYRQRFQEPPSATLRR